MNNFTATCRRECFRQFTADWTGVHTGFGKVGRWNKFSSDAGRGQNSNPIC